jgi:hypothetical protein
MCDSMTAIDIHFSKMPTAEQLVSKATGMAKRSKVALTQMTLSHKQDVIELTKDRQTKLWSGKGQVAGIKAEQILAQLNALK